MLSILLTLLVFHLEISGKHLKELQPPNISSMVVTLLVFHLEISGKYIKEMQSPNVP